MNDTITEYEYVVGALKSLPKSTDDDNDILMDDNIDEICKARG